MQKSSFQLAVMEICNVVTLTIADRGIRIRSPRGGGGRGIEVIRGRTVIRQRPGRVVGLVLAAHTVQSVNSRRNNLERLGIEKRGKPRRRRGERAGVGVRSRRDAPPGHWDSDVV